LSGRARYPLRGPPATRLPKRRRACPDGGALAETATGAARRRRACRDGGPPPEAARAKASSGARRRARSGKPRPLERPPSGREAFGRGLTRPRSCRG